ncbi:TPA: GNAT family N-acetyltransferase [Vibrio parahaemolyticus]
MLIIRPAKINDAVEVCQIIKLETNKDFSVSKLEEILLSNPSSIAEIDGKIAGFCYTSKFAPDILEILNIIVRSEHRNIGIGEKLIKHVEDKSKSIYNSIILVNSMLYETVKPKKSAERFYCKLGYSAIHRTKNTIIFIKTIGV